jgi:putative SbcD/Mre11-related phosphoesterase
MKHFYPLFGEERYSGFYIVPGAPIIYIEDLDAIVFSDLHIGFEEAVARGLDYSSRKTSYAMGMFIPRIQLKRIIETLEQVFNIVEPRRVIINGDIKHAFDRLLRQERREVRQLLDYLLGKGVEDIILVRGNHDNYLPLVLRDYDLDLYIRYEYVTPYYKLLITHGHLEADPNDYDIVLIGHEHPSIRCPGTHRSPAFLKIPFNNDRYIVVLPAMGPYHPGTHVSVNPDDYLSPIIKKYGKLGEASVITWIDLGGGGSISFDNKPDFNDIESSILVMKHYNIDSREVVVVEFKNIYEALAICGSLL